MADIKKRTTKLQDSVRRFTDFFWRIQHPVYRAHFGSALGQQLRSNQQRLMFVGTFKSLVLMLIGLWLLCYQLSKKAYGTFQSIGKFVLVVLAFALFAWQLWNLISAISHLRKSFSEADELSAEPARKAIEAEDEQNEFAQAARRQYQTPPPPPSRDHPARRRGMSINYHFTDEDEDDAP